MSALSGSRIPRIEDEPFLRGKGRYIDDIAMPGLLHAAFVRSPHPHAAIRGVDKSAALALLNTRSSQEELAEAGEPAG